MSYSSSPPQRRNLRLLRLLLPLAVLTGTATAAEPSRVPIWDAAAARHLLSRAAFGGTPEEAARLAALPLERAVDLLLEEAAPPSRPPGPNGSATCGSTAAVAGRT